MFTNYLDLPPSLDSHTQEFWPDPEDVKEIITSKEAVVAARYLGTVSNHEKYGFHKFIDHHGQYLLIPDQGLWSYYHPSFKAAYLRDSKLLHGGSVDKGKIHDSSADKVSDVETCLMPPKQHNNDDLEVMADLLDTDNFKITKEQVNSVMKGSSYMLTTDISRNYRIRNCELTDGNLHIILSTNKHGGMITTNLELVLKYFGTQHIKALLLKDFTLNKSRDEQYLARYEDNYEDEDESTGSHSVTGSKRNPWKSEFEKKHKEMYPSGDINSDPSVKRRNKRE